MTAPIGRTGLPRVTPSSVNSGPTVIGSDLKAALFDDFLGDVIADQWNFVEGTDGITSNGTILATGVGGILRMTTGDTGTGLAADMCVLNSALQWKVANGGLTASARLKLSQITEVYLFFGFTNTVVHEAPITSAGAGNTLTSNASDAVGFMFDTRMADDKFWLVGVKGNIDAVAQNSALAPVADVFMVLRVDVAADGVASFYINGSGVGSTMVNALTAATGLTPVLAVSKTAGASVSLDADVDYMAVSANRV